MLLLTLVVLVASLASHAAFVLLGIHDEPIRQWTVGSKAEGKPVLMLGSSLAYFAMSVSNLSARMDRTVQCYWLPSASTSELEVLARSAPERDATVVCVSLYDLNERIFSDHRAEIVPYTSTIRDLWQTRSDWAFSKKLLAQYPMHYLRVMFPTAGRSLMVMIAAKAKLLRYRHFLQGRPQSNVPKAVDFDAETNETIADWSQAHLLEQVTIVRGICQDTHEFAGPKKRAFIRVLSDAAARGRVTVIVLPMSPQYRRALVSEAALKAFEVSLADAHKAVPESTWLRADQMAALNDSMCFKDLAHMNSKGKRIVTDAVSGVLVANTR